MKLPSTKLKRSGRKKRKKKLSCLYLLILTVFHFDVWFQDKADINFLLFFFFTFLKYFLWGRKKKLKSAKFLKKKKLLSSFWCSTLLKSRLRWRKSKHIFALLLNVNFCMCTFSQKCQNCKIEMWKKKNNKIKSASFAIANLDAEKVYFQFHLFCFILSIIPTKEVWIC